jgi:hypothetical protein
VLSGNNRVQFGKALPVQVSHRFAAESAVFDEDNLVSLAGLVPVMRLAEQTGLAQLLSQRVRIAVPRIKSGSANPAPKLATLIAGMCAGADSIDDIDVLRAGGMKTVFGGVYAPSTVGTLLREFSFGHARQLESVLGRHRFAAAPGLRAGQTGCLLRAQQDRRQASAAQGALAAGDHDQHPGFGAGDRRDAAAGGQGRLG